MKNLKNVVVGIDFSLSSASAVKEAARIARWNQASLTAVHVLDQDALADLKSRVDLKEEALMEDVREKLRKFVDANTGGRVAVTCGVVIGHPFSAMLKAVETHSADLLVLGSRGSGMDEHRTGVLASKCVRKAPTRVLLVRERQDGPFRRVAACVDFSENSQEAVSQGVQIALQDQAELHLIHVFQPVPPGLVDVEALAQPVNPLMDEEFIPHLEEKLMKTVQAHRDALATIKVTPHIVEEFGVGHGIVDSLNEIGADLVVMGTRGRTGIKALLMGTTAERVIHNAPCSTLAIKPAGFRYSLH